MDMEKVHILDHPLLQHKLSILRDERTGVKDFREVVSEIATLMCYEATRDLPLEDVEIKTPITTATFKTIAGKKLAIVPCCGRAWAWWTASSPSSPPPRWATSACTVTRRPWSRWSTTARCPTTSPSGDVIVLDPMLATGGSASAAIQFIKNYGVKHIKLMNIIAAPEASAGCSTTTPTWSSTAPLWTKSSTTTATSFPAWATPATASSAPSDRAVSAYICVIFVKMRRKSVFLAFPPRFFMIYCG